MRAVCGHVGGWWAVPDCCHLRKGVYVLMSDRSVSLHMNSVCAGLLLMLFPHLTSILVD